MSEPTPHAETMESNAGRRWLLRVLDPGVLFPGLAVLTLTAVWLITFNLVDREYRTADRRLAALVSDMAQTYEAQAVRALREIDTTLKLVRYSLDARPPQEVLDELSRRDMLPPTLLFEVRISDAEGHGIASTHDLYSTRKTSRITEQSGLVVELEGEAATGADQSLVFSRRLAEEAQVSGTVSVIVNPAYFVSGYDMNTMGVQGVLALVGDGGISLVRRTGENVHTGEATEYERLLSDSSLVGEPAGLSVSEWDGLERYLVARALFEFPIAIVVGLSRAEQMAATNATRRAYYWRALLVSLISIAVLTLLGRLSRKLRLIQAKALEERLEHARRAEHLAFHDTLTGLPNRAHFSHLLTHGMQHAGRYDKRLALLFLDLDRFKAINDSLGHDAGDELLKEVSQRLIRSVRKSDRVARLGGDEFVVLLPEIEAADQINRVAEKILAAVSAPFLLAGQEFHITVSIGVAQYPSDGEDEQTLMKHADVAMYHAKEEGKNNAQFYSEELKSGSLERLTLEQSLRRALERKEFLLYYQSKVDMATGRIIGMEALLRWQHPELDLLLPHQFIPLAEENGLIVPIGRWVIYTACQQNVAWQQAGLPALSMAVNVSARQFLDDSLLRDIKGALATTGMSPQLLEVEITEGAMMVDMPRAVSVLQQLRKIGVRIAIDDFGTGFSALSRLQAFPLDTIKIDGSFIHDLPGSSADRSLADAIIDLGRCLGLTVVAEGVESAEQVDYLRRHSCDQVQGYYMHEPQPACDAVHAIQKNLISEP
ncbi:putative bifunctional diguanylate cyclase/phosphodiesterase [Franzmannia qiaohouensis]|uniref:EAL domain-containing protein n=1 Tax=Franzmannia qiaohouensis TaxID=1329370 RepID=A0ABU1HI67_9GAMM|nr:EAL domain-containing protein [Halomonas qiaohouensis]MDR5907172.1 EAL domain-containing protein [Halomonas qiaohouensis]